jgi:hypothetical protein
VHGTGVYSAGVGPKCPALKRFPDIKKRKRRKKKIDRKKNYKTKVLDPANYFIPCEICC